MIIKIENESDLREQLVHESLSIASGFEEEVYFDRATKELSFSLPMTKNSWTDDKIKIGRLEAMDYSDAIGFKTINKDFVEIDDEAWETDEEFSYKEYERYYEHSSIVNVYEAESRLVDKAIDEEWFEEIVQNYEGRSKKIR